MWMGLPCPPRVSRTESLTRWCGPWTISNGGDNNYDAAHWADCPGGSAGGDGRWVYLSSPADAARQNGGAAAWRGRRAHPIARGCAAIVQGRGANHLALLPFRR